MQYTRIYKKPDGTSTRDPEEYAKCWCELGRQALKFFPGYEIASYDPEITFEFREVGTISHKYKVSDRFSLSPRAINSLIHKTVPPKRFREDF